MSKVSEIADKLGIKENSCVVAIDANNRILERIRADLPEGVSITFDISADIKPNVILVWLTERDGLFGTLKRLRNTIIPDGVIWAVIKKKTAKSRTESSPAFDEVQAAALRTDLVDNKVLSLSEEEYGIRFVVRKEKRRRPC